MTLNQDITEKNPMELTDVLMCCLKGVGGSKGTHMFLGVPERIYVQTQSRLIKKV